MSEINGACPEANELAAWIDGRVADEVRARLLDHVASCPRCSGLIEDVLWLALRGEQEAASSRPQGRRKALLWTSTALLAASLVSVAIGVPWSQSRAGEAAFHRALVAALRSPDEASAVLVTHPPDLPPSGTWPDRPLYRGGSQPACPPDSTCGEALAEALPQLEASLRWRPWDRRARLNYLSMAALDSEIAFKASTIIKAKGWTAAEEPQLRAASWLVMLRANQTEPAGLTAALASFDDVALDQPALAFNVARLAEAAGDWSRACAAWRRFSSFDSAKPWADEARRQLDSTCR